MTEALACVEPDPSEFTSVPARLLFQVVNPLRAPVGNQLRDWLRSEGCTVAEVPGWQTRTRPGAFSPSFIIIHHTAAKQYREDAPSLGICVKGRADLPGPLCQLLIARSGKVHLISANRTNHSGLGDSAVVAAARAERPIPPFRRADVGGNGVAYGIEVENDGIGESYLEPQLEGLARACAALCRNHGWGPGRIVHHRQFAGPRKIDMSYRGDIWAMVRSRLGPKPKGDWLEMASLDEVVEAVLRALEAKGRGIDADAHMQRLFDSAEFMKGQTKWARSEEGRAAIREALAESIPESPPQFPG